MDVTLEKIIRASIETLNEKGIGGLTTRELARRIGIKSASLYWHIANKQEIYGHIAEYICDKINLGGKMTAPKKYLLELNKQYRSELVRIKDSPEIIRLSIPNTPKRMEIIAKTLDRLSQMGVKEKNCLTAANMLNNYVLSFVSDEQFFKSLPLENFGKTLAGFDNKYAKEVNYDEQFMYGLKVLFAGFQSVK